VDKNSEIQAKDLFGALLAWANTAFRFAERSLGSVASLLIRLWLAETFFVSAVLKRFIFIAI
jgi:hypothetical protein